MHTTKQIKALELDALQSILSQETWPTPPLKHQAATVVWAGLKADSRVALWHDMGTGKTLASMYINRWWSFNKLLVVCPNSIVEEWPHEVHNRTDYTAVTLTGKNANERRTKMQSDADIHIVNYEGLKVLFAKRTKRGKQHKWEPNMQLVAEAGYDAVIFDECQNLSNHKAIQTKIATMISRHANQAIIMSGTPGSLLDLWSQYYVLDGGRTLGRSRSQYVAQYFISPRRQTPYIRNAECEREILNRIAPVTMRYGRDECLDLPPITYTTRYADTNAEQRKLERMLIKGQPVTVGGTVLPKQEPSQRAAKLSQIAGGLLIAGDDTLRIDGTPKLDVLVEILREIGEQKAVVYHTYIEEARMIENRLKKEKIKYASQRGEIKQVDMFRDDPGCRVLIAHPRSGGVGLNLQCASVVIFYGPNRMGPNLREQAEARVYRNGQLVAVTIVDLITRGTVDELRLDKCRDEVEVLRRVTKYIEEKE